jgi:cytoskeletal protein CcmA (bactofilin family)
MLWKKSGKFSVKGNDLTAFIGEGSEIEGKFTFGGTVMLNGRFRGEIVSNHILIVGEKGVVNASIRAGVVMINGEVVGNVLASERVEIRGAARVFGDVEAPVVVVEEGVLVEGHCRTTKARPVEAAPAAHDTVVSLKRPGVETLIHSGPAQRAKQESRTLASVSTRGPKEGTRPNLEAEGQERHRGSQGHLLRPGKSTVELLPGREAYAVGDTKLGPVRLAFDPQLRVQVGRHLARSAA